MEKNLAPLNLSDHYVSNRTKLADFETEMTSLYENKNDLEDKLQGLRSQLVKAQELLIAEGSHGILVILQGMDAAGKDGLIKHIFGHLIPHGLRLADFKTPTDDEFRHDFMWRTHQQMPERGQIGIFNRSYYEEVLVTRVHPEILQKQNLPKQIKITPRFWQQRLQDIGAHEDYLKRQGFHVIKLFLHISKKQQKKRLLKRIDDPKKHWKFDAGDLTERKLWDQYQKAYEDCFQKTSTKQSPWYVIPSDDKGNARVLAGQILLQTLHDLKLRLPKDSIQLARALAKAKRQLK